MECNLPFPLKEEMKYNLFTFYTHYLSFLEALYSSVMCIHSKFLCIKRIYEINNIFRHYQSPNKDESCDIKEKTHKINVIKTVQISEKNEYN